MEKIRHGSVHKYDWEFKDLIISLRLLNCLTALDIRKLSQINDEAIIRLIDHKTFGIFCLRELKDILFDYDILERITIKWPDQWSLAKIKREYKNSIKQNKLD